MKSLLTFFLFLSAISISWADFSCKNSSGNLNLSYVEGEDFIQLNYTKLNQSMKLSIVSKKVEYTETIPSEKITTFALTESNSLSNDYSLTIAQLPNETTFNGRLENSGYLQNIKCLELE
jgi:hypothetical protein